VRTSCSDDPDVLLERRICLSALSKDLSGELHLLEHEVEKCKTPECETLKTVHLLKLEVVRHEPCDFQGGEAFDGVLYVSDLVHAFMDGDGNNRGVHGGSFRWRGRGALAIGEISGITNAGTHREPAFDPCQTCDAHGYMEGRFCGSVLKARSRALIGCELLGTYRLRFDPGKDGGHGAISGALEGALMCRCRGRTCTDFQMFAVGSYANPLAAGGATYLVRDHTGAPMANTEVRTEGGDTGLNCGFQTDVSLPGPASSVETTLVSGAAPATVEAFSGGAAVASATMTVPSHTVETLMVSAAAPIDSVVIHAPNNEVLLLQLCVVT
jgi:hypothetical protein